jgi:PAS domain S-box-containing protein
MGSDAERLELERLRVLLAYATEVTALLDRQGVLVYRSPTLKHPLGYADGLLGKNVLELVHPADVERVKQTFATIATVPRGSATDLIRVRAADGSWRSLVTTATNLLDEPSVQAIVLSYRDVSEQKRAEHDAETAKKLASLGTLAAGIGHEINNPLTSLLFTLDAAGRLAARCSEGDPANCARTLRATVAEARDAAERIAAIVRELRSLVSNEPATLSAVHVEWPLEQALLATQHILAGHAEIRRQYQPVPQVDASEARLEQLFVNLLTNAAHALPRGRAENAVTIRVAPATGGRVQVDVEDNGCGIPDEQLGRVFDPFFSTRRFSGGTGLGLHIAQKIVHSIRGTLSVASRVGAGTTFSVLLPAASVSERGQACERMLRGTVLIVDDEPLVRTALAAALEADHEVVSVEGGSSALELVLGGRQFDAILCDMLMPGMSGIELHAELSQHGPEHAQRIVFITGAALDPELQAFLRQVPNARLSKPPDPEALRGAIAAQVRRSRHCC